jgi:hydroxymethylbilane synthase
LLAAAGLDRLGRSDIGAPIDLSEMLPAPAQGAIGIECRADDVMAAALLRAIDHVSTHEAVLAERAFCRALGGTCHSPVAAHATILGDQIDFHCEILSEDGAERVARATCFAVGDLETPGSLARAMLDEAPPTIRCLFEAER